MLDTRYIHLHEALGLGAMWLKNSAKIIATQPQNTFRQPERAKKAPAANPQARQQLMAFLQQKNETAETNIAVQPASHVPRLHIAVQPARVLALSACPSWQDIGANRLFSGDDGVLLQKMFHAIEVPMSDVQLSCWVKTSPDDLIPTLAMFAENLPQIQQEKRATQAQAILLLGDVFQRDDMQPYVQDMAGDTPVFIMPHPQRVHDDSTLRRPAWAVLQQLQAHLQNVAA